MSKSTRKHGIVLTNKEAEPKYRVYRPRAYKIDPEWVAKAKENHKHILERFALIDMEATPDE